MIVVHWYPVILGQHFRELRVRLKHFEIEADEIFIRRQLIWQAKG